MIFSWFRARRKREAERLRWMNSNASEALSRAAMRVGDTSTVVVLLRIYQRAQVNERDVVQDLRDNLDLRRIYARQGGRDRDFDRFASKPK